MSTRSAVSRINPADQPYDHRRRPHDDHLADDLHEDANLADLLPDRLLSVLARYRLHNILCCFFIKNLCSGANLFQVLLH